MNRNNFERLKKIKGAVVAMTTPIKKNNKIDIEGLEKLTQFYLDHEVKNLIVAGTTGYCYTLTPEEHKQVIETVINIADEKAFIIAGVSHSGTNISNRLADICENAGAHALLMTPPYYHQTRSFEGLFQHYREVAQNHSLPLIIYHTWYSEYKMDLFRKCAEVENIAGVKEAGVDYEFARELLIEMGDRFTVIAGGAMRYFMWHWMWGARAGVTSLGNLVPEIENKFYEYMLNGELEKARTIVIQKEQPFLEVMSEYGWHQSLHTAMKIFGLPAGKLPLPLVELPQEQENNLKKRFIEIGLLKK